jgi:translation initiation factor IF-2
MAITCPRCGAGFDVTLFQFGHRVECDCGTVLEFPGADLRGGHATSNSAQAREDGKMAEVELGKVTHYFSKIGVAAIEITQDTLTVGDTIHVKGHTSDFKQTIDSMQIDGQSVAEATVGQSVGIRVAEHAREHDMVYKVVE